MALSFQCALRFKFLLRVELHSKFLSGYLRYFSNQHEPKALSRDFNSIGRTGSRWQWLIIIIQLERPRNRCNVFFSGVIIIKCCWLPQPVLIQESGVWALGLNSKLVYYWIGFPARWRCLHSKTYTNKSASSATCFLSDVDCCWLHHCWSYLRAGQT